MEKTAKEILIEARDLLETKGWCQGVFGLDAYGNPVSSPAGAVCFCALGALRAASNDLLPFVRVRPDEYYKSVDELGKTVGESILFFNDGLYRTKDDVLRAFDNTIARLNAEEEKRNAAY